MTELYLFKGELRNRGSVDSVIIDNNYRCDLVTELIEVKRDMHANLFYSIKGVMNWLLKLYYNVV